MPLPYSTDISTFAGRLNTAMEAADFRSVQSFAKRTGLSEATVRSYLTGRAKTAGGKILSKMAKELQVTERYLATGEGDFNPLTCVRGDLLRDLPEANPNDIPYSGASREPGQIDRASEVFTINKNASSLKTLVITVLKQATEDMSDDELLELASKIIPLTNEIKKAHRG